VINAHPTERDRYSYTHLSLPEHGLHHYTNKALTCHPAEQRFSYLFRLKKHPYEANTPKAYTLATVGVTDI